MLGDSLEIRSRDTENLKKAADITFENMKPYYQKFAPYWGIIDKILEVTKNLEN